MYSQSPQFNPTAQLKKLLANIGQALYKRFNPTQIEGQQRSITRIMRVNARDYDQEIPEYPVRSAAIARRLIQMRFYNHLVSMALDMLKTDIISSPDGDDIGVTVAPNQVDGTPIDTKVYDIVLNVCREFFSASFLKDVIELMLVYGDCFVSIGFENMEISKLLRLPTWEMFRMEDNKGKLLGFQQRRFLYGDSDMRSQYDYVLNFEPPQIVHFRYNKDTLYGRSLWLANVTDDSKLTDADENMRNACRRIGVDPNLHIMPPEMTQSEFQAYKDDYEARLQDGVVADLYMQQGGMVTKLGGGDALTNLEAEIKRYSGRIVGASQLPAWRFPFLYEANAAIDIAGQPALAYNRFVSSVRGDLTEGLKQITDTALILAMGYDQWKAIAKDKYRLVYPSLKLSTAVTVDSELEGLMGLGAPAKKPPAPPATPDPFAKNGQFVGRG